MAARRLPRGGTGMTVLRRSVLCISILGVLGLLGARTWAQEKAVEFTVVNIEYEGSKIWVPSTLVVHKGDKVKVKLINNVKSDPNQHGFAIAAYNVAVVV